MANWLDESAEAELVQGLRANDPAAAEALERLFLARLKGLARSWGLQDADAYSTALEALMKVIRGIHSFTPRPNANFRSWVLKIMVNSLKDFVRKVKVQREREVSSDAFAVAEDSDDEQQDAESPRQRMTTSSPASQEHGTEPSSAAVVATAILDRLSPREHAVMIRTANGMSDQDIATELRISRNAVRIARLRARTRANDALAEIAPTLDETIHRKLRKLLS